MSIYVGLSRRAQCDRELGAVLVKEDISKPQLSPRGHQDAGIYGLAHI